MWESITAWLSDAGTWTLLFLWTVLLLGSAAVILISLPGGWIALGLAVLYDLAYGFERIGFLWLGVFAGLLVIGEIVESLLGTLYVASKGATRYGMVGGFLGGIAGAILGSGVVPVVGTLVGSVAGSFAGAVGGEYWRVQKMDSSLQVGWHATVGRVLATTVKFALALTGCVLVLRAAWFS